MLFSAPLVLSSAPNVPQPVPTATCSDIKAAYQSSSCCGANLQQMTMMEVSPPPPAPGTIMMGTQMTNPCHAAQPYSAGTPGFPDTPAPYFYNINCTMESGVIQALEQSGTNVTLGYQGSFNAAGTPITSSYWRAGLCPVNVHWHLGAEHLSMGQYDDMGMGPTLRAGSAHRRLEETESVHTAPQHRRELSVRAGGMCHHYDASNPMYTTPYNWKHCWDMTVGMTYEVHWPHSAGGACHTPWQFQTPFYDGVFCIPGVTTLSPLNTFSTIGVQAQIFTIVNNESYYYPDLIRGMVVEGDMGTDMAVYTGSTTGTSRHNEVCSRYTPITWQVDRKCHLISASSFDKMCADMKTQYDDMTGDLYPHGAREAVLDSLAANNQQTMTLGTHATHRP